jgi:pimeloyl-ACP methyl ester carboxylesterase
VSDDEGANDRYIALLQATGVAEAAGCVAEELIADLKVVEVEGGPHNVGWTFPDEVKTALLDFLKG